MISNGGEKELKTEQKAFLKNKARNSLKRLLIFSWYAVCAGQDLLFVNIFVVENCNIILKGGKIVGYILSYFFFSPIFFLTRNSNVAKHYFSS